MYTYICVYKNKIIFARFLRQKYISFDIIRCTLVGVIMISDAIFCTFYDKIRPSSSAGIKRVGILFAIL